MKRFRAGGLALLLALVAPLSGCTGNGEPTNPNLLVPKLVFDLLPSGEALVYLHSAFGDRRYDSMSIELDNVTVAQATNAYSLEHRFPPGSFHLRALASSGNATFRIEALFNDVTPGDVKIIVALADESGTWSDARTYGLPMERILHRHEANS